jgi:c-di-GMP-binding flagellar brake protein YcgR
MASHDTGKSATDGAEKRRHGRLNRTFEVGVSAIAFPMPRGVAVKTHCYDISAGGLSIESPKSFAVGDNVQVRINIPLLNRFSPSFFKVWENDAEQYFSAIAEVVRCQSRAGKYLVGMRYVDVDPDQAKALAGLINKAFRDGK